MDGGRDTERRQAPRRYAVAGPDGARVEVRAADAAAARILAGVGAGQLATITDLDALDLLIRGIRAQRTGEA